jgi:hypothetical protein
MRSRWLTTCAMALSVSVFSCFDHFVYGTMHKLGWHVGNYIAGEYTVSVRLPRK